MAGLLERVADLFTSASEGVSEGGAEAAALAKAAGGVLGAAIQCLGPEDVLNILPLHLEVTFKLPYPSFNPPKP